MPTFSVILPVLNAKTHIQQCLSSLLCQTLDDLEIIAVDCGSTDGTCKTLERNAALDERIKIACLPDSGISNALNTGLDLSASSYVAFLPPAWSAAPDAYATLYLLCRNEGLDMAKACHIMLLDERGGTGIAPIGNDALFDRAIYPEREPLALFTLPSIWTTLFRKRLFMENEIRFYDEGGASSQQVGVEIKSFCASEATWFVKRALFIRHSPDASDYSCLASNIYTINEEYASAIEFARVRQSPILPYIQKRRYMDYCLAYDKMENASRRKFSYAMARSFRSDIKKGIYNKQVYTRNEKIKFFIASWLPMIFRLQRRLKKWRCRESACSKESEK